MPPDIDTLALYAPLSLDELYSSRSFSGTQLTANQETLKRALAASVLFCQAYTRRQLVPEGDAAPVVKTIATRGSTLVRVPDTREITLLRIDGTTATGGYELTSHDDAPLVDGQPAPWLRIPGAGSTSIEITGRFGYLDVPADIRDAIYTDAIRRSKDQDAGFADRVELGDGTVLSYFRTMPARVQATYNAMRIASDRIGAA